MICTLEETAQALQGANDILIITHRRPDGDAVGCAGALCLGLRELGKRAYVLENPDVTRRYAPYIVPYYPEKGFTPRYVVTVDIADHALFTPNAVPYYEQVDLVIDHHPTNPMFGKRNIVRADAGACAEIIFDILVEMGVRITPEIATCIYVGASTDTGCFRYSNATAKTLRVAASCLEAGANGGELNRELFETKSWPRFQMERIILDSMEFHCDGAVAIAKVYRKDMEETGADIDDLDAIAALTRQVEGVEVGITLVEMQAGFIKISVRTKKDVSAAAICQVFGGGGHLRAAGASHKGPMALASAEILQVAMEQCCGTR